MQAYRNICPASASPPTSDAAGRVRLGHVARPGSAAAVSTRTAGIYHFRWFWDYSGGQMTNLGQHSLDIVDWVLDATKLKAVVSVGGRFALTDNGETPDTQDALFEFDGWTAAWSCREAVRGIEKERAAPGLMFFGTKGSLGISREGFVVTPDPEVPPESLIPDFLKPKPTEAEHAQAPQSKPLTAAISDKSGDDRDQFRRHVRNFLDCIRTRAATALQPGQRLPRGNALPLGEHLAAHRS